MREFTLPSLGADMDEGKLIEWLVKPGDVVHKGQVVAVVDTSKAAIDVEIWVEGDRARVAGPPPARRYRSAPSWPPCWSGRVRPEPSAAPEAPPAPRGPGRRTAVAGATPANPVARRRRRRQAAGVPAARKHAIEVGVDLADVVGSGPLGAVTLADVDRAVAAARPGAAERPRRTGRP